MKIEMTIQGFPNALERQLLDALGIGRLTARDRKDVLFALADDSLS